MSKYSMSMNYDICVRSMLLYQTDV